MSVQKLVRFICTINSLACSLLYAAEYTAQPPRLLRVKMSGYQTVLLKISEAIHNNSSEDTVLWQGPIPFDPEYADLVIPMTGHDKRVSLYSASSARRYIGSAYITPHELANLCVVHYVHGNQGCKLVLTLISGKEEDKYLKNLKR